MNIQATVTAPVTIHGEPRAVGDEVEVDANTFANLERKGRLARAIEIPAEPAAQEPAEPAAIASEEIPPTAPAPRKSKKAAR